MIPQLTSDGLLVHVEGSKAGAYYKFTRAQAIEIAKAVWKEGFEPSVSQFRNSPEEYFVSIAPGAFLGVSNPLVFDSEGRCLTPLKGKSVTLKDGPYAVIMERI
jgi:hypothetical protein